MKMLNLPNSVFVDCTASDLIAAKYEEILGSNISIVTPNKRANSAGYDKYLRLKKAAKNHGVKFLYETNVGGGLPIISTIQDLIYSGDKILKIEAVLSGTLSYIFNNFKGDRTFTEVVKEAKALGLTEPDPREDLNGMDVARKLLILARESGMALEMKDIPVESLVPEECRNASSAGDFFEKLAKCEKQLNDRKDKAEMNDKASRYIARFENGIAEVRLEAVDNSHPFYSMSGSDNIISLKTNRYLDRPLVIKGPGAGADVTAAGVFADIISIGNYLA